MFDDQNQQIQDNTTQNGSVPEPVANSTLGDNTNNDSPSVQPSVFGSSDYSSGTTPPVDSAQSSGFNPSILDTVNTNSNDLQPSKDATSNHVDSEHSSSTSEDGASDSSSSNSPSINRSSDSSENPTSDSQTDSSSSENSDNNELMSIKEQALQQLSPLVDKLDQAPEEKFRTIMMMLQASDDRLLVKSAYEAAKNITDDKARAQALLDVINEVNYFTTQESKQN